MDVLVLMIAFRGSTAFAQKPFAFSGLKLPACQYIELVPQGSNFEFPVVRTESANFPPIVGREAENRYFLRQTGPQFTNVSRGRKMGSENEPDP